MRVARNLAELVTLPMVTLLFVGQGYAQPAYPPHGNAHPYQPVAPQGGYPWQSSGWRGDYQAQPVAGGHYRRWVGEPTPYACPPSPTIRQPIAPPVGPEAVPRPQDVPGAPPADQGQPGAAVAPEAPAPLPEGTDDLLSEPINDFAANPQPLAPNTLGDFIGIFVTQGAGSQIPLATEQDIARERTLTRYKVSDNASPEPRCRAFYSFNYFQDAFDTSGDVARNFWGAEITFFRRSASIDIRTNVNSFFEFTSPARTDFGNLFTTFKAVIWRSEDVLFSGGMAVGWPTGIFPELVAADNYYLSPFIGYIWAPANESWFIQGFQQLDFPTQSEDQPLMHTDIGVGLWLYEWGVCSIAPTVELHAYTPFGDPPSGNLTNLTYRDVLNMTVGSTLYVTRHFSVASGVGFPLLSQSDYNVEFQLHVNWFF